MANLNDVQATKHKLVTEILKNSVYTPASGIWCRLYNRLMTMAKDDLASLKLVLDLKLDDAGVKAMELASDEWARKNPGAVMRAEEQEYQRKLKADEI